MGIRIALGADTWTIVRTIAGDGLRVTIVGLVVGLGVALASARFVRALLFGVTPYDSTTFVGASIALLVVALLACVIPAVRAAATDPMLTLRAE
jgi:putative ABC transport system permease protein